MTQPTRTVVVNQPVRWYGDDSEEPMYGTYVVAELPDVTDVARRVPGEVPAVEVDGVVLVRGGRLTEDVDSGDLFLGPATVEPPGPTESLEAWDAAVFEALNGRGAVVCGGHVHRPVEPPS